MPRHRAPGNRQGLHAAPARGDQLREVVRGRRRQDRQGDAVLLDARHAGDLAPGVEGQRPLAGGAEAWADFNQQRWELFDTENDPSECHDLADQHPEKLAGPHRAVVGRGRGSPGASRSSHAARSTSCSTPRPQLSKDREPVRRTTPVVPRYRSRCRPNIRNRSYTIAVELEVDRTDASGVLFAQGARFGGHALYLKDGHAQVRLQLGRRARADDRVERADTHRSRRRVGHLRKGRRRDADGGNADAAHPRPGGWRRRGSRRSPASSR